MCAFFNDIQRCSKMQTKHGNICKPSGDRHKMLYSFRKLHILFYFPLPTQWCELAKERTQARINCRYQMVTMRWFAKITCPSPTCKLKCMYSIYKWRLYTFENGVWEKEKKWSIFGESMTDKSISSPFYSIRATFCPVSDLRVIGYSMILAK